MRVVCAPDSFKGSLSGEEAAAAMQRGVLRSNPGATVDTCPVADGGEGFVATMAAATGGEARRARVMDPLGRSRDATFGMLHGNTAVVEIAAASGLTLLAESERDPMRTSSFGTGQVIVAALDAKPRRILLGLGGSATNDGGCGAAQALGVRFFDAAGTELEVPICGADLQRIARIDTSGRDGRLAEVELIVCRDVDNPLSGPSGAAVVYGPQKGADPAQVVALDRGLARLATLWRDQLGVDVDAQPGAGAAGGMGGGAAAMLGAVTARGIDTVLAAIGFAERIAGADLCMTGEGRLDGQSLQGKACFGVSRAAKAAGVPVHGFFGQIAADAPTPEACAALGMGRVLTIGRDIPLAEAMQRAAELLEDRVARSFRA